MNLQTRYWRLVDTDAGDSGYVRDELECDAGSTALLIVDAYGRVNEQVPTIYRFNDRVVHIIDQLIPDVKSAASRVGMPVIYVTNALHSSTNEGTEWRNLSIRTSGVDVLEAWKPPTPILEYSDAVAPGPYDIVIEKQMYSGFFETGLDNALRSRGIRNLIVTGFDTRVCLGSTVSDALFRNYRVVVLRDCTWTREFPETREGGWANFVAIRHIEAHIGWTATSADFVAACAESGAVASSPDP